MKPRKMKPCFPIVLAWMTLLGAASCAPPDLESQTNASEEKTAAFRCVDAAIEDLEIDLGMSTEPELLQEILRDDMFLDGFRPVKELLGAALLTPEPMRPMLERIRTGIATKHPAIVDFLCAAHDEGLLPAMDENASARVKRTIHHTLLLDAITKEMFDNTKFMVDIQKHLLGEREKLGIHGDLVRSAFDILKLTRDLFFTAKTLTMDWVFSTYEETRTSGVIDAKGVRDRQNRLILNIVEAVIEDKRTHNEDNALTGIALAINPAEDVRFESESRVIEYVLSPEWTRLYETWNLAFITANMQSLQLFYPKLLIPQVLCAESNDYMFNRALSLWTSINFYLLTKASKRPETELPGKEALARRWGEINLGYAREYVKKENGRELRGLGDLIYLPLEAIKSRLKGVFGLTID